NKVRLDTLRVGGQTAGSQRPGDVEGGASASVERLPQPSVEQQRARLAGLESVPVRKRGVPSPWSTR
ncbi:MAG TPA: hypothetical protein VLC95_14985, partial [Anaerolineae bacterium]|nr:hypothetical protein [Anaerolineae bacterium]